MLEAVNLSVYYSVGGQELAAVKECTFQMERHERFGIIGESGSGKTTLARALMGLGPGRTAGAILLDGVNLSALDETAWRSLRGKRIALSFPNSVESFHPLRKVRDQVAEVLTEHREATHHEALNRAGEVLIHFGLDVDRHNALPHQLSGGERQRALLAMAFVGNPRVVILDEPTMGLDYLEGLEILDILNRSLEGRTALVISHDIQVVWRLCNRVGVMYAGRFLEIGPVRGLFSTPLHPYTRALLNTIPGHTALRDMVEIRGEAPSLADRPDECPFHPRCTQSFSACSKEVPVLTSIGDRRIACHRGGIIKVLEARDMAYTYRQDGGRPIHAVQRANITLYSGDFQVLVGETGSGKTTLARMISGLLPVQQGRISMNGDNTETSLDALRRKVQMIFQDPRSSISHRFTVEQIVREPLDIQKNWDRHERNERVKTALHDVGLPPTPSFLAAFPHQLSEGEVQRVVIARAIVQDPEILVADEPTSMLDPSLSARIMKLFLRIQQIRGLTVFMVSHDVAMARRVASYLMVMLKGRIIEAGIARDVITEPWHPYTRGLLGYEKHHSRKQMEPASGLCPFLAGCSEKVDACHQEHPLSYGDERHRVSCHRRQMHRQLFLSHA